MRRTLSLALLFIGSWWILSEGDHSSWALGAPSVVLAVRLAQQLRSPSPAAALRLRAVPGFAWFFLSRSLVAGLDVARRTLSPSLPMAPAMRSVQTTLPTGVPRVLLVGTLSLLPGTLAVSIDEEQLTLHVLDARLDVLADVRRTEARIALLFTNPIASRPAA